MEHSYPLGNLSPCSPKHIVGLEEFFMSHKEKGLKLPCEHPCPPGIFFKVAIRNNHDP